MSKIIVTGATGNAGSAIVSAAVASPNISQVTVLARRAPYESSPKIHFIQIPSEEYPKGFDEMPPSLMEKLKGHTACVWALGISQNLVNKEDYIKITHDYTMTAAKAFSNLGTESSRFRFVFMSGEGARQDGKGYSLFSKVKGRTEKELAALNGGSLETVTVRPGGIVPSKEHVPRQHWPWGPGLRIGCSVIRVVYPSMVIDATHLAKVCLDLADGKGWSQMNEERVIPNVQLLKM